MAQLEEQQVLEGHTARVWNVAWSPTGTGSDLAQHSRLGPPCSRHETIDAGPQVIA